MKPTQTLPENYRPAGTFDITQSFALIVWLNVLGFGLLALSGWLLGAALFALRPGAAAAQLSIAFSSLGELLKSTVGVLLLYAVMIVLHEGAHGAFFWLFTRKRPVFALKIYYAYAAAPDWFLPRNEYFITAVAPLVSISLLALALFAWGPPELFLPALALGALNASGAVADVWVAAWLLRQPRNCYAQDRGDKVTLYTEYHRGGVEDTEKRP